MCLRTRDGVCVCVFVCVCVCVHVWMRVCILVRIFRARVGAYVSGLVYAHVRVVSYVFVGVPHVLLHSVL